LADRPETAALYKKEIKFPASLGDWTTYRPPKAASKKIKPLVYGFHRIPTGDLEKTLNIHNLFTFEFANYLKEALKAAIDVHSINIEQVTYLDFLKRISGGIIYSKLPLKDIGDAMLIIDYQLANLIINFSLGCQSADTKIKELTELEESILQSIMGNVLDKYAACWDGIFDKPGFEIISYPNIQRETYINLNEVITVISVQISLANSVPATLTFVYQNKILKKLFELLLKKEEARPLKISALPEELLSSIEVPVLVELGMTSIPTQDLTGIEAEDLICLDHKLNEPIQITIGYASQLKAQPGMKNNRLAVRILSSATSRIKGTMVVQPEEETKPAPAEHEHMESEEPTVRQEPESAEGTLAAEEEEDFELPLEEEGKEEYNETAENPFEEENDNPKLGGN